MWGQVKPSVSALRSDRIIPTRVGTSHRCCRRYRNNKDHPHACGDKRVQRVQCRSVEGSSPRVWGQAPNVGINNIPTGIIPTRVGTSTITQTVYTRCGDHPHACGDKTISDGISPVNMGSSPRVWGQVPFIFSNT